MKNNFFNKIKTRFWRKTMLTSIMVLVFSTNAIRAQEFKEHKIKPAIPYTEKADILILHKNTLLYNTITVLYTNVIN